MPTSGAATTAGRLRDIIAAMRYVPLVTLVSAAALAASAGLGLERGWWRLNHPAPARFPLWGIDVSHHQGEIDWHGVASEPHVVFAYLKATEGGDWVDPRFEANWRAARQTGLRVGAYHFFTFCRPAADQARNFLAVLPRDVDTLPPAVDVELGGNCALSRPVKDVKEDLRAWLQLVEAETRRQVLIYATWETYTSLLPDEDGERRIWIRDIWSEPRLPRAAPWSFWQFANRARLRGIGGFVDLNVFQGDRAALEQL